MIKLTIPGRLPGLNEYISAERSSRYKAAKLKADCERLIIPIAKRQLKSFKPSKPVRMWYIWYEINKKRDKDNVCGFGHKVIQDSLVKAGVLKNDSWAYIDSFRDEFFVDAKNPRIEVYLGEI